MLRLLYIAYYFPPIGGAGVQRSLKFVKHLRDFGIDPIVLTTDGENTSKWAPKDETLVSELPEDLSIIRQPWLTAKTQGYDLSSPQALAFLDKAAREAKGVDAVLVTMSPFEDSAISKELAKRLDVPWIADLRDPWVLDEFQTYRTFMHRNRERKRMLEALTGASLVIMNTPESAKLVRETFTELADTRISFITNGYDADDFASISTAAKLPIASEKLNITHTGTFHTALGLKQRKQRFINRILGRTHPDVEFLSRSPHYLLRALNLIKEEQPTVAKDFNLIFAGSMSPADKSCIENSGVAEQVSTPGYLDHKSSVSLLTNSDALFFPMHSIANHGRSSIVPGKLYEYMASGRVILGAVPNGDASDFLDKSGNCVRCIPNEVDSIKEGLLHLHKLWRGAAQLDLIDTDFVQTFERRELTRKLSREIKSCLAPSNLETNSL